MLKSFQARNTSIYFAVRYLVNVMDLDEEKMGDFETAVATKNEIVLKQFSWIDPHSKEKTLSTIKECFKIIHDFLKNLYFHERDRVKDIEVQKGIRAIMIIASEAVQNLDKFTDFLNVGNQSISQVKEYQELLEFYQKKLVKKLQKIQDQEELWKPEWGDTADVEGDVQQALEDLRSVVFDKEYELFYLKKEDGSRFFTHNLLRQIKLIRDFYHIAVGDYFDSPNKTFGNIRDKNCYKTALTLKQKMHTSLGSFLSKHKEFEFTEFYSHISKCIYALFLASSIHNEEAKGATKSCFEYFNDAWKFLEAALDSPDYHEMLKKSKESDDKDIKAVIHFINDLCFNLFTRLDTKDMIIGLIYKLLKKDKPGADEYVHTNSKHLWNSLIEERDFIHDVLMKYPNSPLYNTIDNLYIRDGYRMFEPLLQQNYSSLLYKVHNEKLKSQVLRLPSPTKQEQINEAKPSKLFSGFIEGLKHKIKDGEFLLFNLQDKTSWREYARVDLLEELPEKKKFRGHLSVCTLPCASEFYMQEEEYEKLTDAKDFKKVFIEQIKAEDECGFHYSHLAPKDKLCDFSKKCIEHIHKYFFSGKEILSKKNRQEFIDIFYFFFSLKITDHVKPNYMSFSCKDSLDTGPCISSGFFAFVKLMGLDPEWSKEEEDYLAYLLFSPSLLVRQRVIKQECSSRTLSALSTLHAELEIQRDKVISSFESLYGYKIFKNLCAEEIKD